MKKSRVRPRQNVVRAERAAGWIGIPQYIPNGFSGWGWTLPATALFILGGVNAICKPGVCMDAVNPELYGCKPFDSARAGHSWVAPARKSAFRPVSNSGQYLLWGLNPVRRPPAYALFGTGVVGIRAANIFFGLPVLAGTALFLRTFRVRPAIAGLCLAALALDPGFLFSFRTQFYTTLLPDALLLTSVALTERSMQGEMRPRPAVAGLLAGAACYGYFKYAFMAPAAFFHATGIGRHGRRSGIRLDWWVAGFALGVSPYLLSLILLIAATGVSVVLSII
jgi:hypothetical protein